VIVLDTSAIVAILRGEAEREAFSRIIAGSDGCFFSTVGYLEASMVIVGRGLPQLADEFEGLLSESAVELVAFDEQQARVSRAAFIRFGKGRHPAGLNFGDCVSYALAQTRALPLLYKGGDFAKTDVISALE